MARAVEHSFAGIIALARVRLTQTDVSEEIDSDLATLTVEGRCGRYRVIIKETVSPVHRRYAFYLLLGDRVMLGLDNHADRPALRLKYGDAFAAHIHDLIPHRHGPDKVMLGLTDEWTAQRFLNELDNLITECDQEALGGPTDR